MRPASTQAPSWGTLLAKQPLRDTRSGGRSLGLADNCGAARVAYIRCVAATGRRRLDRARDLTRGSCLDRAETCGLAAAAVALDRHAIELLSERSQRGVGRLSRRPRPSRLPGP